MIFTFPPLLVVTNSQITVLLYLERCVWQYLKLWAFLWIKNYWYRRHIRPVFLFSPLGTGHGSLYTRPRTAKFYFTKDTCVKTKVKSHLIKVGKLKRFRESFKSLENHSYNRRCELAVSWALRKGTSSLIQPTPTKYIFCFEVSKRIPPAVITPACMIAEDQNMNPQRICMTLRNSIVRDATHQYLCRSPIIGSIQATRNRL